MRWIIGNTRKGLRRLVMVVLLVVSFRPSFAQDQEIQQLLLNVQKLNQLKELLTQMKEKYEIIQQGYMRVRSVTEGNFQLHEVFLNRLYQVNPKVKTYYRVGEIIQLQIQLLHYSRNTLKALKSDPRSSLEDIEYLAGVFSRLTGLSMRNLEELIMLITDNQFQMDDGERIRAVDRLYLDMRRILLNGQQVTAEFKQLFQLRSQAAAEQFTLKNILGNGQ